jgi:FkbM family methyltransferase
MLQDNALETLRRYGWLRRVRPMAVGAYVADLLAPDRRMVIETDDGLKLLVDPLNHLGQSLLNTRGYEPETVAIIRQSLRNGDCFLDIGANEGFFSVLAGRFVGSQGIVGAVEPQARLVGIIESNARLNGLDNVRIFQRAMGGGDGQKAWISLYPSFNTGSSSMSRYYRFSRKREQVGIVSAETLLSALGREHIDLVKIDVEGFEHRVVESLVPLLREGRVGALLLDYHRQILKHQGVDPGSIERSIINAGLRVERPLTGELDGYRLYRR